MNARVFVQPSLSFVLCVFALACSGNDARKCTVATLSNGDVRVVCPGSRTILIPAGADAAGGGDECRSTQNATTGEYLLECQGTTVSLGRCGLGFNGSIFVGAPDHPELQSLLEIDRRMNARNLATFLEDGCTRILGTLYIAEGSAAELAELTGTLEHAQTIRFVDAVPGVAMPNLRAAALDLGNFGQVWSPALAPKLSTGGVRITGGTLSGDVELLAFQQGVVSLEELPQVQRVLVPSMREGRVSLVGMPNLQQVDFSSLESAREFRVAPGNSLGALSLPALESVDYLELDGVGFMTSLELPRLVEVGSAAFVSGPHGLRDQSFPRLQRAGILSFSDAEDLRTVDFPELRVVQTLSFGSAPNLSRVGAPLLEHVEGGFIVNTSGQEDAGVDLSLPRLLSAGSFTFDGTNLRAFEAPVLNAVASGAIVIEGVTNLVRVTLPMLQEVGLKVHSVSASLSPLVVDLSTVSFTRHSASAVDVEPDFLLRSDGVQPLSVNLEHAEIDGAVAIQAQILGESLRIGQRFSGSLHLEGFSNGSAIDLSNAILLRYLNVVQVGSVNSRWIGRVGSTALDHIRVSGSFLEGLSLYLVNEGTLQIINGNAIDELEIQTAPQTTASIFVDSDVTGTTQGDVRFSAIRAPNLTRGIVDINVPATRILDFAAFVSGDVRMFLFDAEAINFGSFVTGTLDLTTFKMPLANFVYPTAPPVGSLTGIVRANWVASFCSSALIAVWPNVDSVTQTSCMTP